jgi:hypothetical protein
MGQEKDQISSSDVHERNENKANFKNAGSQVNCWKHDGKSSTGTKPKDKRKESLTKRR